MGSNWATNTIKFGRLIRVRIVFIDCDSTDILVVSGGGINELETESRRVWHESEGVRRWITGEMVGRERGRMALFYRRQENLKEIREMKTD